MIFLTDNERMQYLDGVASAEITALIVNSSSERSRVAQLATLHKRFHQLINPNCCPDVMELGEYYLDTLDFEQSFSVSLHVQHCTLCQQKLAQTMHLLDGQETQQLFFLYPQRGDLLQATRSASMPEVPDSYTFRMNEAEINVALQHSTTHSGQMSLWGLLTGLDLNMQYSAELRSLNDRASITTAVAGLGDFSFEQVTNGEYELVIRSSIMDYVLRGIVVAA
ncbi:MAG: hypothetical protein ACPG8W_00315 [Candidatus Promineifilaceae bacterium]